MGHDAAQEVIHRWEYILINILRIGGFSTRRKSNEFVYSRCLFPVLRKLRAFWKDFVKDFRSRIRDIWPDSKQAPSGKCVDFSIRAGIAQGQPTAEIDQVIDSGKISTKRNWTAAMRRRGVNKWKIQIKHSRHLCLFGIALHRYIPWNSAKFFFLVTILIPSLQIQSVTGLRDGNTRFNILGIEIGMWNEFTMDQESQKGGVEFEIKKGTKIYDDAIASIKTEGLRATSISALIRGVWFAFSA